MQQMFCISSLLLMFYFLSVRVLVLAVCTVTLLLSLFPEQKMCRTSIFV